MDEKTNDKLKDELIDLIDDFELNEGIESDRKSLLSENSKSGISGEKIKEKIAELNKLEDFSNYKLEKSLIFPKNNSKKVSLKRLDKYNIKAIKKLYMEAFPKEERINFPLLYLKARSGGADFLAAYDNDNFIGLAYVIYHGNTVFLFFFAVKYEHRNKGYGSLILDKLKRIYHRRSIVLWIECTEEAFEGEFLNFSERMRRKKFYQQNGFKKAEYGIREKTVDYDVMYCGKNSVSEKEMHELLRAFFGKILYNLYYVFI